MSRSPEMREPCGDQQGSKTDEKEVLYIRICHIFTRQPFNGGLMLILKGHGTAANSPGSEALANRLFRRLVGKLAPKNVNHLALAVA
jgi:hypothetical protein